VIAPLLLAAPATAPAAPEKPTTVLDIPVKDIDGQDVDLSKYKGQVLLIVNTASQCGYTPQYQGLEELYRKYKDRGFEVLAFPANEFGRQEPGTNAEIKTFCTTRYDVSFPLFAKIVVKGEGHSPAVPVPDVRVGVERWGVGGTVWGRVAARNRPHSFAQRSTAPPESGDISVPLSPLTCNYSNLEPTQVPPIHGYDTAPDTN
jgi:hypothetical protein